METLLYVEEEELSEKEELLFEIKSIKKELSITNKNKKSNQLIEDCKSIETSLLSTQDSDRRLLLEYSYQIIDLRKRVNEAAEKRMRNSALTFGLIVILYGILIISTRAMGANTDDPILLFLQKILVGLVGFMAYLFSNEINSTNSLKSTFHKLLLAVLFPLIIVSVFSPDFKTIKVQWFDLLCLAAGFSAEIVIKVLNGIVKKADNFIEKNLK